ncbi:MAG: hypothetical protein HY376_02280 [Candidatus Blackburnbacteria bacterium]|nr:hypothetical protein [Candidatus Blackburnbacteria bacterium]
MAEIIFKASRRNSGSHSGYRQIEKRGDLEHDQAGMSDDVIILYPSRIVEDKIIIDCDKKTGEFHLKFTPKQ